MGYVAGDGKVPRVRREHVLPSVPKLGELGSKQVLLLHRRWQGWRGEMGGTRGSRAGGRGRAVVTVVVTVLVAAGRITEPGTQIVI